MAVYPPPQNILPIFNQIEYYYDPNLEINTSGLMKTTGGTFTGNVNFLSGLNSQSITMGNNNPGVDKIQINVSNTLSTVVGNNNLGSTTWRSVAYSPELNRFVAVKTGGTGRAAYSTNGNSWTPASLGALDSNQWYGVCWAKELQLFVAVGVTITSNPVMTSPDGINWTGRAVEITTTWVDVCWSPELGMLAAVGNVGTNRVMTSQNGINWTIRTIQTIGNVIPYNSICWSPELNLFVAVGSGTTPNKSLRSSDGITWIPSQCADEPISVSASWKSITWCAEIGLFIATSTGTNIGLVGSVPYIQTSTNGINWVGSFNNPFNWRAIYTIEWCPEIGLAIAVCGNDSNNTIMTFNGNTWTTIINSGISGSIWEGSCWNGNSLLVVSSSGLYQSFISTNINSIDTTRNDIILRKDNIYNEKVISIIADRINALRSINTTNLNSANASIEKRLNINIPALISDGAGFRSNVGLIPPLTGYSGTSNGVTYTVSAISEYSPVFAAFRPCQASPFEWATNNQNTNIWWKVEMSIPQRIWKIFARFRPLDGFIIWWVEGSNDDINWYVISSNPGRVGDPYDMQIPVDYSSPWRYIRTFCSFGYGPNPGFSRIQIFGFN